MRYSVILTDEVKAVLHALPLAACREIEHKLTSTNKSAGEKQCCASSGHTGRLEHRRELAAARKRNAGKPGTSLLQAAKELEL